MFITSGNSPIDSGLTDDGDERNMNLVSMDVERKGIRSNLNRSKSKSSSKYLTNCNIQL